MVQKQINDEPASEVNDILDKDLRFVNKKDADESEPLHVSL